MSPPLDRITVLHVDDDADFAETAARYLEHQDERLDVRTATEPDAGLERLEEDGVDCVVSDYEMPGNDGLAFFEAVRVRDPEVPFILFTGKGSEDIASEAISAGVTDYVQKGGGAESFELLANRIVDAVDRVQSQLSYREVFEKAGVGLTIRDLETFEILDANRHYCELLGYDREELNDLSISDITADVEGYDAERATRMRELAEENGSHTFEWPDETKDGELRWVEVTIRRAEIEGQSRFLVSVRDIMEHKRREAELEETKDRLELALEGADLGVWDWDLKRGEITYDERWAGMLGYSLGELDDDPTPWLENIHPEDRPAVLGAVEEHRRGETDFYEIDHRMQTKSGDWKWIRAIGRVVERDADGDPVRAVGIHQDITDRKEAQRRLQAERDRFVQGPTVVFQWGFGAEWPVEYVSPNVEDLLGYSAETLESGDVSYADVVHGDDFERVAEAINETVREGAERLRPDPYRVRTADGAVRWVLDHTVITYEDGEPVEFLGYVVDITERKEFEQGLTALQTAAEDLWEATDRQAVFDVMLETAAEFLAFDSLRILTAEEDSILTAATRAPNGDRAAPIPLDEREHVSVRAFHEGESILTGALEPERAAVAGEYRAALTVPLGDRGVFQAFAARVDAFDERDRELAELLADHVRITLTRLEQESRMREQRAALRRENERLEDFVRIVSHDLRNPLNVVDGQLELAREGGEEHLRKAHNALDRAFELIDDLRALAREGTAALDPEPTALEDVARDCWDNVETEAARIEYDSPPTIEADPARLQQLLENLFRNAVEHGGQDITITVGPLEGGFYVADDGPGIPADEREDVFEPGYSTSPRGTGFGLSIVAEIAEAHGWDVAVTDGDAGGARFEFSGVDRPE